MNIADLKHNHSLTDLLKVSLFSILMLAPVLSVGVRSLYVICNKNAYQSYSNKIEIVNEYETNDVETLNDLVVGRAYTYTYDSTITTQTRLGIEKILLNEDLNHYDFEEISLQYDTTIRTNYTFNGTTYNSFTITPLNTSQNGYTTLDSIDFIYGNTNFNQNADAIIACISKCNNLPIQSINNEDGTLDNVFEYSVDKLADDDLFSWTQETAIFTGVKAMTDQLEVNTLAIPVILTYWFLLSVIYVIIDIILKCFTVLTHLIGSKTA